MPPASWPIASILLICVAEFLADGLWRRGRAGISAPGASFAGFLSAFLFACGGRLPENNMSADMNSSLVNSQEDLTAGRGM
jgi:hypothetical protein